MAKWMYQYQPNDGTSILELITRITIKGLKNTRNGRKKILCFGDCYLQKKTGDMVVIDNDCFLTHTYSIIIQQLILPNVFASVWCLLIYLIVCLLILLIPYLKSQGFFSISRINQKIHVLTLSSSCDLCCARVTPLVISTRVLLLLITR